MVERRAMVKGGKMIEWLRVGKRGEGYGEKMVRFKGWKKRKWWEKGARVKSGERGKG